MMKQALLGFVILGLASASAQAANLRGFRSATFGSDEKSVIAAISKDLGVASNSVIRSQNPDARVKLLTVKIKNFEPLNLPATVSYQLGYKCDCLTRVSIQWSYGDKITADQRRLAMQSIAALVDKFQSDIWKTSKVSQSLGEPKDGGVADVIFFSGLNEKGQSVALVGGPAKMVKREHGEGFTADVDVINTVVLAYDNDVDHPDIYRVDVSDF